jgi:hypothetical protein
MTCYIIFSDVTFTPRFRKLHYGLKLSRDLCVLEARNSNLNYTACCLLWECNSPGFPRYTCAQHVLTVHIATGKLNVVLTVHHSTVDPRGVTTGLTYEQLGLRPTILVLTYDQSLELRPARRSRPKRAVVNKDPRCVRKRQSEPRYACLWT